MHGGRGLYYSGTAVQMLQLQLISAHFSLASAHVCVT